MRRRLNFSLILCCCYTNVCAQGPVIDSLQKIISLGKADRRTAFAMNKLANELVRSDVERAKIILYQAITVGKTIKDARTLSASYSHLTTIFQNTGKMDSALFYLTLLHKLSVEARGPDMRLIKENYNSTAGLYYKRSGNPKLALPYFIEVVRSNENDSDKVHIAGQLLNLGNTYRDLGDYKAALKSHLRALKFFEETGNMRGKSFCYQSISNSFADLKQYKNALQYSREAIKIKTQLNDKRGLGTAQDGLGNIYFGLLEFDLALAHYTSALKIAIELKLLTEQAKEYFNIGKVFMAKKDVGSAISNFNRSKQLAWQLGDSTLSSAVEIELISLQNNVKSRDAEKKMISSLGTLKETGDRIKEAEGYKRMAAFYTAKGEYDNALTYTNKYYRLNDSVENNELQLQLKKMEEQYTLEKKENEITILKKDQELSRAKLDQQKTFRFGAVLFFSLMIFIGFISINRYRVVQRAKRQVEIEKMRNGIARDLHDDIGSTISSINILGNVLLNEKHDEKTIYSNIQKMTDNSAFIMESMSDIVWAINPHNDTLEKMIDRMKELATEILEPLDISFNFENEGDMNSVKMDPSKRRDIYLIYREALNNAAKYSNCTRVDIGILYDGKHFRMNISDNGDGFDEKSVRKGNGIFNIRERAKEIPASLHYNSTPGKGTSILLDAALA